MSWEILDTIFGSDDTSRLQGCNFKVISLYDWAKTLRCKLLY